MDRRRSEDRLQVLRNDGEFHLIELVAFPGRDVDETMRPVADLREIGEG